MKITTISAGYRVTVPGPIAYSSKQFSVDLTAEVDESENPHVTHDQLQAEAKSMVNGAAQEAIQAAMKGTPAKAPPPAPAAPAPQPTPQPAAQPQAQGGGRAHAQQEEYTSPPYGEWAQCLERIFVSLAVSSDDDFKRKDIERNVLRHLYKYQKKDGTWGYTMANNIHELATGKFTPQPWKWGEIMEGMARCAKMLENGDTYAGKWTKFDKASSSTVLEEFFLTPVGTNASYATEGVPQEHQPPQEQQAPLGHQPQPHTSDDIPF